MSAGTESAQAERPAQSIQRSSRRALPLGLLGTIAIVIAAEGYVGRRHTELNSIFTVEWRHSARSIPRHAAGPAVLCFGTSLSRMGVSPLVIEEKTGMTAYNFSQSGSQPFANYASLRKALECGATPRAIVVDYAWTTLGQPDAFNEIGLSEVCSFADLATFSAAARDATLFVRMALARLLPSLRGRNEIRANITAAVRGEEPHRNIEWIFYAKNVERNNGACHPGALGYDGAVDPANSVLFPKEWSCTAANERYIDAFFDLAGSRGIPVFWIMTPMTAETRALWGTSGTRARYTGFVEQVAARHANVTVVDASDSRYPVKAFNDPVHLNRDGAVSYSADVADAIRGRLDAGAGPWARWVKLPDYRADPRSSRVEDMRGTAERFKQAALRRASRG